MFYLYIYNNICCLLTININNTYILTCNISIKKKGGGVVVQIQSSMETD